MLQIFSGLRVALVNFRRMKIGKMENIKNTNCIHPNSPHNNGEHEDTNEDDGAVEDDHNHDREQTVGWQKREGVCVSFLDV